MADFSLSLMQEFSLRPEPVIMRTRAGVVRPHRVLQWKGGYSALCDVMRRAIQEYDQTPAGKQMARHAVASGDSLDGINSWAGVTKQPLQDFISSSFSLDAQESFKTALSTVAVKPIPSARKYTVTSGLWSVPRAIQNHPKSAITRERSGLPPLTWEITASFMAMTDQATIAQTLAKLARAAWDYQLRGGQVSLIIHYVTCFSQARPDGTEGIIWSIKVPLTNPAALASCLSIQTFRIICLSLAQGLTGVRGHDGIPVPTWEKPGACPIEGHNPRKDAENLARFLNVK